MALGDDWFLQLRLRISYELQGSADKLAFSVVGKPFNPSGDAVDKGAAVVWQFTGVHASYDGDVVNKHAPQVVPGVGRNLFAGTGVKDSSRPGFFSRYFPFKELG